MGGAYSSGNPLDCRLQDPPRILLFTIAGTLPDNGVIRKDAEGCPGDKLSIRYHNAITRPVSLDTLSFRDVTSCEPQSYTFLRPP
jgi:hypothetical protein